MIVLMTRVLAPEIAAWAYDAPYDVYSFSFTEETINKLLGGDYYAALEGSSLIVYICFGEDARIETIERGVYSRRALDIGLGLKPELCGHGKGREFMRSALVFAAGRLIIDNMPFRLTVAEFNRRAIRLYQNMGFEIERRVTHAKSRTPFYVMYLVDTQ